MDENKRRKIYRDFQRFLVEDSPVAFLEHLKHRGGMSTLTHSLRIARFGGCLIYYLSVI